MHTYWNFIYHTCLNKSPLLKWQPFSLFPSILPLSPKNSAKISFKVIKCIIVCGHLQMAARGQACGGRSLLTPLWVLGGELWFSGLRNQFHPVSPVTGPKRNWGWLRRLAMNLEGRIGGLGEKWGYIEKSDKEYVPKLENNMLFFCNLIFKAYFTHFHSNGKPCVKWKP